MKYFSTINTYRIIEVLVKKKYEINLNGLSSGHFAHTKKKLNLKQSFTIYKSRKIILFTF